MPRLPDRRVLAWALYDWANSAFATAVMAGFFPLFFKQYWSAGVESTHSTQALGMANSAASLLVAAAAPLLGAIADRGSAKKRFLLFFAALGILMTGALYFVGKGEWGWAATFYVLAAVGFAAGNIFYDALILAVAENARLHFVSALGFSLGYLGGGLLFAFDVWMTLSPETFGLAGRDEAIRLAFLSVALWWAAFAVPLFLLVPEPRLRATLGGAAAVSAGLRQLATTFRHLRRLRVVGLFLLAYWLYIDGVDTIVRMAVDYGASLGFPAKSLVVALLVTQFVGFPAAIAYGWVGERVGAKPAILFGIAAYAGITVWGSQIEVPWEFYTLAVLIGLVQGGVQSLSRSLYAHIIPPDKAAEFFGFYNMLGKFAAIIGPALMGYVAVLSGNHRIALLAILPLFLIGGLLLWRVDEAEGRRMAERLEDGPG